MAADPLEWGETHAQAALSLSVDKAAFAAAAPIYLTMVLKNEGRGELVYLLKGVWDDFEFEVAHEGEPVGLTRFGRQMTEARGAERTVTKSLAGGQSAVWEILISRYFDMTTAGAYRVRASRPVLSPGGDSRTVQSNELEILVDET